MNRYFLLLLTAVVLLLPGCASTRDMAKLVYSTEAEGSFLDNNGTAKYNYYVYNGSGGRPVAYMALDKRYSFTSQFWYPTNMSATLWREMYRSTAFLREDDYRAKVILSSQAEPIGYMITRHYMVFAWQVEPGSSVVIVPPPQRSLIQPDHLRWRRDSD